MNTNDLEDSLRSLPPLPGLPDWADLEVRLAALRPTRQKPSPTLLQRMRKHPRRVAWVSAGALVLTLAAAWMGMGRQPAVDLAWRSAHQEAMRSDPWADPWVSAAMENAP